MTRSTDDAIERTKVREVAAVFHSHRALEAAVKALLAAGFDRADIDRLADLDEVGRRLGPVYVAHEDLADIPQTPRQPVIMREDITVTTALAGGLLASLACVVTALIVVASGVQTAAAITIALLVAFVVGGIGALLTVRVLSPPRSKALEPQMEARGLILWVRVRSTDREEKGQEILLQNGGQAIRAHEIELEKHAEEIPLSSLQPDPWLGSERLGQP